MSSIFGYVFPGQKKPKDEKNGGSPNNAEESANVGVSRVRLSFARCCRPIPKSLSRWERDFEFGSLLLSGEGLGMRGAVNLHNWDALA